jgi:hypothetical protein
MSGGTYKDVAYFKCDLSYSSWIDRLTYARRYNKETKKWDNVPHVHPITLSNVTFKSSILLEIRVQDSVLDEITNSQSSLEYRGTFTVIAEKEKVLFYKIFICYARENEEVAISIFNYLCKEPDMDPWIDKISLLPGQHWEKEIPKAIHNSDVIIILMSKMSMLKRGYVQREVRLAFDVLKEIPDGEIFIVPIKLDCCEVEGPLNKLQWVEYDGIDSIDNVIRSIRSKEPLMCKFV